MDDEKKEDEFFDTDAAYSRISAMWLRFAERCEEVADTYLEGETSAGALNYALKFARHAEAAYWQATGESETHNFSHNDIS